MDFSPSEMLALIKSEPQLQPWQQRLIAERDQIAQRLSDLGRAIDSPNFEHIDTQHQNLMLRQRLAMVEYLAVLNERVALL